MAELILLDIFSYSCMNCLRSLDYIKKLDKKYRKSGLKGIIIHPPEWNFEKQSVNIMKAAEKYNIKIPIVIDKNYFVIKRLKVDFWPTQILIKDNKILYKHVGEGNYKGLENSIVENLRIKAKKEFKNEPKYSKFPTIYCGKKKKGNIRILNDNKNNNLKFGIVYSDDKWAQNKEYIKSLKNNSALSIKTAGKITNFVAESLTKNPIKISIELNNKKLNAMQINSPQLYRLAESKDNKENKLTINADKNLAVYSFSFQ